MGCDIIPTETPLSQCHGELWSWDDPAETSLTEVRGLALRPSAWLRHWAWFPWWRVP